MSKFIKALLVFMAVFYFTACLLPYAEALTVAKSGRGDCDGGECPLPPPDDDDGDCDDGGECPLPPVDDDEGDRCGNGGGCPMPPPDDDGGDCDGDGCDDGSCLIG